LLAERRHFTSFKGHLDDSKACTRGAHEELKTNHKDAAQVVDLMNSRILASHNPALRQQADRKKAQREKLGGHGNE
jgi:hypothetical protein